MIIRKTGSEDIQTLETTLKKIRRFVYRISYGERLDVSLCTTLIYLSKTSICDKPADDETKAYNTLLSVKIGWIGFEVDGLTEEQIQERLRTQIENWCMGIFGEHPEDEEAHIFNDMWDTIVKYRMIHKYDV